ncbi:MAG TPA: hypothetical protein VMF52_14045 [Steroidobacteraceae bacterium]|nr:hypothetical protein [Steroidobacteraceae bacterium]
MEVGGPAMSFPTAFCANCGALDCQSEVQDTRITRYFALRGSETTFRLPVPVCARCRRSLRRRPPGFFARVLLFVLCLAVAFLLLLLLNFSLFYSDWLLVRIGWFASALAIAGFVALTRLRRPKSPQTSFYQPVRIKAATLAVADPASGAGRVTFMKLGFTNPDYLNLFRNSNADAIQSGNIAAVKA